MTDAKCRACQRLFTIHQRCLQHPGHKTVAERAPVKLTGPKKWVSKSVP